MLLLVTTTSRAISVLPMALLQELLMTLRANEADGYKSWLALGIEELGRDVAGEVESDWMVPLLAEEERDRLIRWQLGVSLKPVWGIAEQRRPLRWGIRIQIVSKMVKRSRRDNLFIQHTLNYTSNCQKQCN